jgi:hypothetical protein
MRAPATTATATELFILRICAYGVLKQAEFPATGWRASQPPGCHSACNIDPLMEWAPRGGRDQATGLTVCRVCCFSNCIGLI